MARRARQIVGDTVYHVVNRGCGRMKLFGRDGDYAAFEQLLAEAQAKRPTRLLTYCVMPNHWHLVLWPDRDGQLGPVMHWLTMTHVQRWRHSRQLVGLGPLYQGRYRAFPVESDEHLLTVCRYVERNPVRAELVRAAQDWKWSGLSLRQSAAVGGKRPALAEWPVDVPADWVDVVNQPQTDADVAALRKHSRTGRPFGTESWGRKLSDTIGHPYDPPARGRPRKTPAAV